jgi:membrane-associated phospholipid phosphatase
MNAILDFGVRFIVAIQGLGGWLKGPMEFFSFLGREEFFLILLPILYWCVDSRLGLRVAFILLVNTSINDAFKLAFHGPRPYWYSPDTVEKFATETSFGVPSGHAQSAVAVWGMLAAWMKKWWAWLVAGIIAFLIGFSRMYLGVHFPHDVLLGWLLGGLLLWLTVRFWDPVAAWAKKLSMGRQVLAAFVASLVLIVLPLIPYLWLKLTNWQPDPSWASYATEAVSLSGAFTSAGVFFGLLAGLAWLSHRGGFKTTGVWWKLVLRFLVGVVGVLVFYLGLDVLFGLIAPDAEAVLPFILRFVRYAFVGAWVSAGAPWLFIRLKLAEPEN